ncbi:hypothetical protein ZOSMA_22G01010 [Zostera marina]|uniref:Uncharacterized protein n=1 Tax=Zostera marina TaxID=29655 RepID=A0A0K9PIN2_ZOSMR|nr:hypothetical protein ZOSMA_22G01010 [Zostera marina]
MSKAINPSPDRIHLLHFTDIFCSFAVDITPVASSVLSTVYCRQHNTCYVAALSSICLLLVAGNVLSSSLSLHWDMCQRFVADWSVIRIVLHVGCGTWVLLNSVAMQQHTIFLSSFAQLGSHYRQLRQHTIFLSGIISNTTTTITVPWIGEPMSSYHDYHRLQSHQ